MLNFFLKITYAILFFFQFGLQLEMQASDFLPKDLKFTYLDLIDPSIQFSPVMNTNRVISYLPSNVQDEELSKIEYSIFPLDSSENYNIPGYSGNRCIVEYEMALELKKIQKELKEFGPYALKIFDTYRPQQAVDFFGQWVKLSEDKLVKQFHHPNVNKEDFHKLSYIAQKSSHSLGTAIDLTIVCTNNEYRDFQSEIRPKDFLGIYDPSELDMGNVGYLAFDFRSSHYFLDLTSKQKKNRSLLLELMNSHNFQKLNSEFWHYFYKRERNKENYYNFLIKDNYKISEEGFLIIN